MKKLWYSNRCCNKCGALVYESDVTSGRAAASKTKRKNIVYLCENVLRRFLIVKKFISQIDLVNVSVSTWVRFIQMIISIIAIICKIFNVIIPSIDDNILINIVIGVFTVISFLQCYWKNNSFTTAAQVADIYMHNAKEREKFDC